MFSRCRWIPRSPGLGKVSVPRSISSAYKDNGLHCVELLGRGRDVIPSNTECAIQVDPAAVQVAVQVADPTPMTQRPTRLLAAPWQAHVALPADTATPASKENTHLQPNDSPTSAALLGGGGAPSPSASGQAPKSLAGNDMAQPKKIGRSQLPPQVSMLNCPDYDADAPRNREICPFESVHRLRCLTLGE